MMEPNAAVGRVKKRVTGEERKKSIVATTIDIVAQHGVQGATTARIAAAEGISEKILYRHFAGRREILLSALDAVFDRATRILRECEGANAVEYLRAAARLHWPSEPEFVYPLFEFIASSPQEDLRAEFRVRHQADLEFVANIIEEGKTQGVIREDVDSDLAAWEFWAVCWAEDIAYMLGFDEFGPSGRSSRILERYLEKMTT
jgi:AcrR family transcriptional regulator